MLVHYLVLAVWVAHAEGKFNFPYNEDQYQIVSKFSYKNYLKPKWSTLTQQPLLQMTADTGNDAPPRAFIFPWNWAHYPEWKQSFAMDRSFR